MNESKGASPLPAQEMSQVKNAYPYPALETSEFKYAHPYPAPDNYQAPSVMAPPLYADRPTTQTRGGPCEACLCFYHIAHLGETCHKFFKPCC